LAESEAYRIRGSSADNLTATFTSTKHLSEQVPLPDFVPQDNPY